MSKEEKVYKLLSQTLNPFETKYNFNEAQLRDTTSKDVRDFKVEQLPDPRIPASLQKLYFKGTDFLDEHKDHLMGIIDKHRENIDLPFDELYHE